MSAPDLPETWKRLDDVIDRSYKFKNGQALAIGITLIDSGGHFTQTVYKQCRKRKESVYLQLKVEAAKEFQ